MREPQQRAGRTFATKRDADLYLSQVAVALERGEWSDPRVRQVLLGEYADEWVAHRKIAVRTRELYEDLLRLHIQPQLGGFPVTMLTPRDVRLWHGERATATGATRLGQAYRLLKAVLGTAVQDGLLKANPCQIRGAGSVSNPERPLMSRTQMHELASAMPSDMRGAVHLAFWAHLRMGELLALQVGDLLLHASEGIGALTIGKAVTRTKAGPVVKDTKTGHSRVVTLPAPAVQAMAAHFRVVGRSLPSAPLFPHRLGGPLREHHVRRAWKSARDATGLTQFHFHDLRHAGLTFVAADPAVGLKHLQTRAGHRTVRAAMIYQHLADGADIELARRLSRGASDGAGEATYDS